MKSIGLHIAVVRSKRRLLCFVAVVMPAMLATSAGIAEQLKKPSLRMSPPEQTGAGQASIDGGAKLDPNDWPATLKYVSDGRATCTATIVGPRVVVTAAHCLEDDAVGEIDLPKFKASFTIHCNHHPRFEKTYLSNDVALCLSSGDFPSEIGFESVKFPVPDISVNARLFLLGYGCRDVGDIGNPEKIGQLYGGHSSVIQTPTNSNDHILTQDGVVICRGDSGGAAYLPVSEEKPNGMRSIVGLNSGYYRTSRISAISVLGETAIEFIQIWAAEKRQLICGLHPQAKNCRT
ncbi:MAG: S1 family peptidase [Xanthobacteraceae bacterium]|nr:S1 family peptidase [Xanthobacteraceae bacterium]